ncbi:MAG: TrkA C-terminal domain-containing protein [Microcoleus sp.]
MRVAEPKLIQVAIEFNSIYCGINLNAIRLPDSCHCLGLNRGNRLILASDRPTICCGDTVLAVALNSAFAIELEALLKKTHSILWTSFRSPYPRSESNLVTEYFLTQLCCKD